MIPRVLLFQAKTSGEEDAGEGQQECNDALRVGGGGGGWDIGAALSNLYRKATPQQGPLPEEAAWYPGANRGRGVQTLPINGVK